MPPRGKWKNLGDVALEQGCSPFALKLLLRTRYGCPSKLLFQVTSPWPSDASVKRRTDRFPSAHAVKWVKCTDFRILEHSFYSTLQWVMPKVCWILASLRRRVCWIGVFLHCSSSMIKFMSLCLLGRERWFLIRKATLATLQCFATCCWVKPSVPWRSGNMRSQTWSISVPKWTRFRCWSILVGCLKPWP